MARRVQIETGEQRGDLVAVASGLSGGELVVQAGANKLMNNAPVSINKEARLQQGHAQESHTEAE